MRLRVSLPVCVCVVRVRVRTPVRPLIRGTRRTAPGKLQALLATGRRRYPPPHTHTSLLPLLLFSGFSFHFTVYRQMADRQSCVRWCACAGVMVKCGLVKGGIQHKVSVVNWGPIVSLRTVQTIVVIAWDLVCVCWVICV